MSSWGFPGGSVGKNPPTNAGDVEDLCLILGKITWKSKWKPTPVFLPGKFYGQRSLAGYDPLGWKELDKTERLSTVNRSL